MTDAHGSCEVTDGCITCGDVAVPLEVLELAGNDARCRDDQGRTELVALDFVTAAVGDWVLVHAGVALERLVSADAMNGGHDALR